MFALKEFTSLECLMPKSHYTFNILRMHELPPSIALQLLKSGMRIFTIVLITVVQTAIGSRCPDELRYRFGQHAPVLPAFFELLLRPFLLLNIGAGANPVQDRALSISLRHASDQKPAIRSACA